MSPQLIYRIRSLFLIGLIFGISHSQIQAQNYPEFQIMRQEEDWTQQKNMPDEDFPGDIKFIPLSENDLVYISLGGEIRSYLKLYDNEQLGAIDGQDGYFLQRIMAHGAIISRTANKHIKLRAFVQLKSGLIAGRGIPASPINKDKLDLNQAFFETRFVQNSHRTILLRAGRQELQYGFGRMIDVREGPNVRFGYDALLGRYETQKWKFDAFATLPNATNPGVFDNGRISGRILWGMYGAGQKVDIYYLGFSRSSSPGITGNKQRSITRHTIGARWHKISSAFSYDVELAFQFGQFGERANNRPLRDGSIRAWNLNLRSTYSLSETSKLGTDIVVSSGDSNPNDQRLGTFAAPYPSGRFTGEGSIIGPFNLIKVQPFVDLNPRKKLHIIPSSYFFWRYRTSDHLYSMSGAPYWQGQSNKRYIGIMPELLIIWKANRHISAFLEAEYFFGGSFLDHFENSNDMLYLGLRVGYKF